ncbi:MULTISPECIES: DUF2231 domain-containing protein [Pseudomonas]|uniref:DUF2231 domain-containing protein n=1 Tax=Pseudomonas TaxID=286 RepID=UPI00123BF412|nr:MULTISPECIES: DUF2231 domain-containing protein [Pseudomonas]QIB49626.1 hypothetical protein G3M63_00210 [Pseudomonas sp. OIL-1]
MTATVDRHYQHQTIHPLHATLLASTIPLFLGALLSDIAYFNTFQIQWSNFASWLLAGGLVFNGLAILCAIIGVFRAGAQRGKYVLYLILLIATWILGFINALQHAKDAWAIMPTGLVLSVIVTLLACAATWVGLTNLRSGAAE